MSLLGANHEDARYGKSGAETLGIANSICGLTGPLTPGAALAWLYYDESGEYDAAGQLTGLTMGCCVSTAEKWCQLERQWRKVLEEYGVPRGFHMAAFESWRPPFDFKLPDGSRDKDKHNGLLNTLLALMIEYVEGMHGYASTSILREGANAHREYFEDCVVGAVGEAVNQTWRRYEEPLHLVFDRQNHFPEVGVRRYLEFYDFGEGTDRIGSMAVGKPTDIVALQAADILAYEMSKYQRPHIKERYPFLRLREACREGKFHMTIKWGPIRSHEESFSVLRP